LLNVRFF